jgi:hypothetical protein
MKYTLQAFQFDMYSIAGRQLGKFIGAVSIGSRREWLAVSEGKLERRWLCLYISPSIIKVAIKVQQ